MKRSKGELFLDAWIALLNYLDRHHIQGRIAVSITFSFLGIISLLLSLRYTATEIIEIINALK